MSMTDLELCNIALLKIGATTIPALSDSSVEAEVARTFYPIVLRSVLSAYPWKFSLRQQKLNSSADEPVADFAYSFDLPDNFIRIVSAGLPNSGRGLIYQLLGSTLRCDAVEIVLTYQTQPDEADFPPHFQHLLTHKLAAEFCLPLTESTSRASALYELADLEFKRARLVDSQQSTPAAVEDFTLISVRN